MTIAEHYRVDIFWSEEDAMFVAVCPDLWEGKGVSALGDTREDALREFGVVMELLEEMEDEADVVEALEALEEMKASGEQPIPWVDIKAELGL